MNALDHPTGAPAPAPTTTVTAPADGSVARWTDRYAHAVMDTFGPPRTRTRCGAPNVSMSACV